MVSNWQWYHAKLGKHEEVIEYWIKFRNIYKFQIEWYSPFEGTSKVTYTAAYETEISMN